MTRTPALDAQQGLTDNTELRMQSLRLRRTEQLGAWDVARRLGVSTSTVLVWWEPAKTSLPELPAANRVLVREQKRQQKRDLVDAHRRATVLRGDYPIDKLVHEAHRRYEHRRKVQMAVAGASRQKKSRWLFADAGRGTGVIAPRRQHEVLPKQVPWMEDW